MAAITSAIVADQIMDVLSTQVQPALVGNLRMANLVVRDYQSGIFQKGDTVNVPLPPVLTANNIAETGSVSTQNPSPGNVQVRLNQHIEATFNIPDVLAAISNVDQMQQYLAPAVVALAERVETDLFALYPRFSVSVGSTGAAITEAVVDSADKALFDAKVPDGLQRFLALASTPYSTLRNLGRLSEAQTIGSGDAIVSGNVGTCKGFGVFRSQYATTLSGPIYHGIAFVPQAMALVTRQLPDVIAGSGAISRDINYNGLSMKLVMSYNPTTLSQQFTIHMLYGVSQLRKEFGIDVISNA